MSSQSESNPKIIQIAYTASPTLERFHHSPAFVRCVKGPVGSGKSVGMCFELFRLACLQEPNHQRIRKTRALIIRNTLPELKSTTMKTWKDWFPPSRNKNDKTGFGLMTAAPPYTHFVEYALADGTKVEMEVMFLALDQEEDVKKLLSLECSFIWFNEARYIKREIVDASTARAGRYPSAKDGGCTRKAIIMDTNPPADDHWWYHFAEEETPEGWAFFDQPSGLDEDAENLENLEQPTGFQSLDMETRRKLGRRYYESISAGKTQEWIDVYVHGRYGFIRKGQPVYAACWNPAIHVATESIRISESGEIHIGIDCSGRHPAAIFAQRTARGHWQIVNELCILDDEGMGAVAFADLLAAEIRSKFKNNIISTPLWGDPAGNSPSQNDERTYFDILNEALRPHQLRVKASPGLRVPQRIQSVEQMLSKLIDGQPALMVSPVCKNLIRGFNGGYMYRTITSYGEARADDKPYKNRFADVHDALQYFACGVGNGMHLFRTNQTPVKTRSVAVGW